MLRIASILGACIAALLSSPALAQEQQTAVQPGQVYTLTGSDQLLLPSMVRNQDVNGVGIALPRPDTAGTWPFEYYADGKLATFRVQDSAALRLTGKKGELFTYTLPVKTITIVTPAPVTPPAGAVHAFRNGVAMSNSQNGYIEDSVRFVAPYIFDGGIRSIRVPLKARNLIVNGAVADTITLNGYATKQKAPLKSLTDLALANDVQVYFDQHEYELYSAASVVDFWLPFGKWLMDTYGYNPNIVLELQNESGRGGWDPNYPNSVKDIVAKLRAAGITYKLAIGWGGWNSVGNAKRAFTELDTIGGPQAIDPLNRIIWTGHFYQTTTGNDQPKAGQSAPQISGSTVSPSFVTFFDECKTRDLQCTVSEIGMGGGARGWLKNGSNVPAFDGKAWFAAYSALADRYRGNLVGTIVWGGGSAWADTYPYKVEYSKDAWSQTKATDFYATVSPFWKK